MVLKYASVSFPQQLILQICMQSEVTYDVCLAYAGWWWRCWYY